MLIEIFAEAGGNELLDTQLDLPFFGVDGQYLRLDNLAGSQHILRMIDVLVRH